MHNDEKIQPTERLKDLFNTPDEKSAVKVMCRQLLYSLNLLSAPIPLKPICQKFNLNVKYNNVKKQEDSFLKLTPSGFEIEISRDKNWRRNRFTIAHELTHLIIYQAIKSPINSFDRKQHDDIETLCDIGASELLINEIELEKKLKEEGLNKNGLKKIYDTFMTSYDALFYKLSEYLNVNIVIWKNYARNEMESKEYRVYKHFPSYKKAYKSTWLPNGCTSKHIKPLPFKNKNSTTVIENFKILMNGKVTNSQSITFLFPHSSTLQNNLPIFDNLIIPDESTYDDCFVMFIFNDKNRFERAIKKYIRYE